MNQRLAKLYPRNFKKPFDFRDVGFVANLGSVCIDDSVSSTGTLGTNGDMATTVGTITKTSDGNPCNAWDFDGSTGYQHGITGTNLPLANTDIITVSIWFRPDMVNVAQVLLGKGAHGTGFHAMIIGIDATGHALLQTTESGVGNTSITTTNTMIVGNLYHIVAIHNGTTNTIYLNAVTASKGTGTGQNGNNATAEYWSYGNRIDSGVPVGGYFNGKILQATIWASALSETNVTTLYNSGVPITPNVDVNNIKAYHNFEQKSGTLTNRAI